MNNYLSRSECKLDNNYIRLYIDKIALHDLGFKKGDTLIMTIDYGQITITKKESKV